MHVKMPNSLECKKGTDGSASPLPSVLWHAESGAEDTVLREASGLGRVYRRFSQEHSFHPLPLRHRTRVQPG